MRCSLAETAREPRMGLSASTWVLGLSAHSASSGQTELGMKKAGQYCILSIKSSPQLTQSLRFEEGEYYLLQTNKIPLK